MTMRKPEQRRVGNNIVFSTRIILALWVLRLPLSLPEMFELQFEEELEEIRYVLSVTPAV